MPNRVVCVNGPSANLASSWLSIWNVRRWSFSVKAERARLFGTFAGSPFGKIVVIEFVTSV
jgi:hypothetical protein